MTIRTRLCDRFGLSVPVIQAPVGGASCPALAAAVSEAGGLGSLSITWRGVEDARAQIREIRANGIATLLVDKNHAAVCAIADRCVVLVKGRVVFAGESRTLLADRDLLHRHLGV